MSSPPSKVLLCKLHQVGFVMRNPLLGSMVVGATSVEQLDELIDAALGAPLEPSVIEQINAIHEKYPNPAP